MTNNISPTSSLVASISAATPAPVNPNPDKNYGIDPHGRGFMILPGTSIKAYVKSIKGRDGNPIPIHNTLNDTQKQYVRDILENMYQSLESKAKSELTKMGEQLNTGTIRVSIVDQDSLTKQATVTHIDQNNQKTNIKEYTEKESKYSKDENLLANVCEKIDLLARSLLPNPASNIPPVSLTLTEVPPQAAITPPTNKNITHNSSNPAVLDPIPEENEGNDEVDDSDSEDDFVDCNEKPGHSEPYLELSPTPSPSVANSNPAAALVHPTQGSVSSSSSSSSVSSSSSSSSASSPTPEASKTKKKKIIKKKVKRFSPPSRPGENAKTFSNQANQNPYGGWFENLIFEWFGGMGRR